MASKIVLNNNEKRVIQKNFWLCYQKRLNFTKPELDNWPFPTKTNFELNKLNVQVSDYGNYGCYVADVFLK